MPKTFTSDEEFADWNEGMFKKHTSDRIILHPNPLLRFIEHQRVRKLLKYCNIQPQDKVLEVGCGSGYILNCIPHGELYGIDLSTTAISWAKEKLKGRANVKLLAVSTAEHTQFPDNTFDVVYCSEVIEHVANPKKVFEEICRIAKPDARVVFTFPNEGLINFAKQAVKRLGLYKLLLKDVPEHMEDEWHVTEFSKRLFKHLAGEQFTIIKVSGIPFFFSPLRYAAKVMPRK